MQAKQIVLLANQIAKGAVTGMVQITGQMLNLVLEDLKLNRDLKVNRVTQMITCQPGTYGPFALEGDYLRTYDLFYPMPAASGSTVTGLTIRLTSVTMEQFDMEFKSPSTSNYPYEFATDLSTQAIATAATLVTPPASSAGLIFIYPQSSGQLVLTHRYMVNQPDIPSPETSTVVPWFSYTDYLITATAARMMGVTGDDRHDSFMALADKMLRPHLIMEGDEQETVKMLRLDPRHFRAQTGLKPTKNYPF
jgi:hypothetical protein